MYEKEYIKQNMNLLHRTLEELTEIAAPSNQESKRADYCVEWIKQHIGETPLRQACDNVILAYPRLEEGRKYTFLMAHLDTVFPVDTILKIEKDGNKWSCPGIGDDTANVAILLLLAKYVFEIRPDLQEGILFAFDVGEEGLGNLRGSRELIDSYGEYCKKLISFDLYQNKIYTTCVGSIRYRITINTQGGHSFFDFGKENAIALMAHLIEQIYEDKTGIFADEFLTYNVGVIEGGTSVNTIAQDCSMQFEFRSTCAESLLTASMHFQQMLKQLEENTKNAAVACRILGERPCARSSDNEGNETNAGYAVNNINTIIEEMAVACETAIKEVTGHTPERSAASTDCNYPLSKGIPSICVGLVRGGGAHTLEEWIDSDSLAEGLEIAICIMKDLQKR